MKVVDRQVGQFWKFERPIPNAPVENRRVCNTRHDEIEGMEKEETARCRAVSGGHQSSLKQRLELLVLGHDEALEAELVPLRIADRREQLTHQQVEAVLAD